MKRSVFQLAMIQVIALLLSGCGKSSGTSVKSLFSPTPDKDVTASSEYNFSSFAGTVWKTKTNTAVAQLKRYSGAPEVKLLAPDFFDPNHPKYRKLDDMKIISVLPPGNRLRITRLMQDQGAWGGVQVEAVLLDGTNGHNSVLLDGILLAGNRWFRGPESNTSWNANPEFLDKADTH